MASTHLHLCPALLQLNGARLAGLLTPHPPLLNGLLSWKGGVGLGSEEY